MRNKLNQIRNTLLLQDEMRILTDNDKGKSGNIIENCLIKALKHGLKTNYKFLPHLWNSQGKSKRIKRNKQQLLVAAFQRKDGLRYFWAQQVM